MIKSSLWITLYNLAKLGAYYTPVKISTTKLAREMGVSQQTASRHLINLEKHGLIERHIDFRGEYVRITDVGREEVANLYHSLRTIIEAPPRPIIFEGVLFSGFREGAYYMRQKGYRQQFIEKLGFDPYPGTLNLKLISKADRWTIKQLRTYPPIVIEGFEVEQRSFGPVKCYQAIIEDMIDGAVIFIKRTHYNSSVVEVIAQTYLRGKLKLKDGDKVRVKAFISNLQ